MLSNGGEGQDIRRKNDRRDGSSSVSWKQTLTTPTWGSAGAECYTDGQQWPEKLDRRWLKDGCVGQQAMMWYSRRGDVLISIPWAAELAGGPAGTTNSMTPDLRLPSQPQTITALPLAPNYSAWWQIKAYERQRLVQCPEQRVRLEPATCRSRVKPLKHSTPESRINFWPRRCFRSFSVTGLVGTWGQLIVNNRVRTNMQLIHHELQTQVRLFFVIWFFKYFYNMLIMS